MSGATQPHAKNPKPKVSLRARQKQYTHQLLLECAEKLFEQQGYVATTIDDIASSAGTTRATFYLHFVNKDALLIELSTANNDDLAERLKALDAALVSGGRADVEEWLIDSLDFMIQWFRTAPYWDAAMALRSDIAEVGGVYLQGTLDWFPRYKELTGASISNPAGLKLLLMFFTLERLVRWESVPQLTVSRQEQIATIASMWYAAMHDPQSPAERPKASTPRRRSRRAN